ncbi:site-2 protease family protein [Stieleria varia]|uniref:Putative zinc metalloprotease n=1 Tax=Stieleria varia TaxID=2528005 RepID=A0A5C6ANP8_9BACT|nr:site-2 protease family protein [Stieleria varia]TWU01137.1 putative zinc metalloprotease [Stieleria varia]
MTDSFGLLLAAAEPDGIAYVIWSQVLLWTRVALGIGFVIFVHELGHFLAAKTFGVKCEKFYVGFDVPIKIGPIKFPRTLGKFTYGETEYGIGIIPLGGYVKMLGQDDDPRKAEEEAERIRLSGGSEEDDEPVELDPRSYPAKKVWQRMIIISAGVVMNVITGIMFAAIAFGTGVPYTPSVIGGVSPGGPAWQAGVQPGGQVVAVDGLNDNEMHFREMRSAILHGSLEHPDSPIDVTVKYDDGDHEFQLDTTAHPAGNGMRMIGITSATSTTLSEETVATPNSIAATVLTDSDAGASIVGFDGNKINEEALVPGSKLFDYMYTHPDKTITLELRRADGSQHTVEMPPQPSTWSGIRFAAGPVMALIKDGPAEKAGMQVGDVITSVDGETDIDAESLLLRLATEQPVKLSLKRGEETVDVTIQPSDMMQTLSPTSGAAGQAAVNAYGFAFDILPEVAAFDSSRLADDVENNQPLSPGDKIQEVRLLWTDEDIPSNLQDDIYAGLLQQLREGWEFSAENNVANFSDALQFLPADARFRVFAKSAKDGTIVESVVKLGVDERFRFERGIGFTGFERVQTASSMGQAIGLGFREAKRRMGDVFRFLRLAVRGQVSRKQVGGPIMIFKVAGMEAKRGLSAQLMFLTMLSMNLAVLNFLPVPALDGGHMVFLTAELIRGKRVNEELEMRLTLAGVLLILALMAFVIFNDIAG